MGVKKSPEKDEKHVKESPQKLETVKIIVKKEDKVENKSMKKSAREGKKSEEERREGGEKQ